EMTTRRTTRAVKNQGSTLTDHFLQSRIGSSDAPIKPLGDDAPPSAGRAKRALFSSASRVEVALNEVEFEMAPTAPAKPKARTARQLFAPAPAKTEKAKTTIKEEPVKVEMKEETKEEVAEPVRSIIPTETESVAPKAAGRKLRTVADLQAELAKKGAARVHQQTTTRKLELVAEREALLKSPQKSIQTKITGTGASPPKRAKKESKKRAPVKVLPVPDFVLPTKSVEKARERPVREASEEREASPVEDSMTRAPKGYGVSLMTSEVREAARIDMPDHHRELLQMFIACDQLVSLNDASGKTLTLSALSTAMQKRMRKSFPRHRFAQLLTVFPNAYRVQLKQLTCVGDRMGGSRAPSWEYVIKPNLDDDLTSFVTGPLPSDQPLPSAPLLTLSPRKNVLFSPMKGRTVTSSSGIRIPASPRKPASPMKPAQREVEMDLRKRLEGWRLTCRQQVFRCLLSRRVLAAHDTYLRETLKVDPSSLPASSSFLPRALHPSFVAALNSACPLVDAAPMDEIPEEENATRSHQGMGEFLKLADDTVTTLPKAVEVALAELRSPVKPVVSSRGVPLSPAKFAEKPRPMSLLERIKAKETERKLAEMARDPEMEMKIADLTLLTQKILRLVFNIFLTASRTSMDTTRLAEQVASSGRISQDNISALLGRLPTLVPAHFSIHRTTLGEFLRITDNSPAACEKVESLLRDQLAACKAQAAGSTLRAP
ncbi:hypothetical protein PFISCL1PPCAC_23327, partial [Pristionchus fissidentatus]